MKKSCYDLKIISLIVIILMLIFIAFMSSILIVTTAKNAMSVEEFVLIEGIKHDYGAEVTVLNQKYTIDISFFKNIRDLINKFPILLPEKLKVIMLTKTYIDNLFMSLF